MSDLNWQRVVTDVLAFEAAVDPWKAFIGLVTLRKSTYIKRGDCYLLDSTKAGFPELGISVLLHQDDVPDAQKAMREAVALRRDPNESELAAWLYWRGIGRSHSR